MATPINTIRNALYDEFRALTGAAGAFEGFVVEKFQDPHEGFVVPGITIQLVQSAGALYGLGSHRENQLSLRIDLVFKETHYKDADGSRLWRDELAQWYLTKVLGVLESVDFGEPARETGREVNGTTHREPQEGTNAFLYGCIAQMTVLYEGDV